MNFLNHMNELVESQKSETEVAKITLNLKVLASCLVFEVNLLIDFNQLGKQKFPLKMLSFSS